MNWKKTCEVIPLPSCRALVISCMDFRFHSVLRAWLEEHGLKDDYDLISLPGAARDLAVLAKSKSENTDAGQRLLEQVELSLQLHGVQQVLIFHHENCAGYGLAPAGPDKELAVHRHDLQAVGQLLAARHPGLQVETYFMTLTGEVWPV